MSFANQIMAPSSASNAPAERRHIDLSKSEGQLRLSDGRMLTVEQFGPPDGRPVLYFHNMFGGLYLSPAIEQALRRHRIRLILPWRPGFYTSTHHATAPDEAPAAFAKDVVELLDRLGIARTIIVAQTSSNVYAVATHGHAPDRIIATVALGGLVPIIGRRQIDQMRAWPRLFAYTARYFPAALSMLVRGTLGMVVTHRPKVFFRDLFAGSDADMAVLDDPVHFDNLLKVYSRVFHQGTAAYELDARLSATLWSPSFLDQLPVPMLHLHGDEDRITAFASIQEVAETIPNLVPIEVKGTGQLMLHQKPDFVLQHVDKLLAHPTV